MANVVVVSNTDCRFQVLLIISIDIENIFQAKRLSDVRSRQATACVISFVSLIKSGRILHKLCYI